MPITNYPFSRYTKGHPRPWLPIRLINPKTKQAVRVWGLVDTGADDCTIPAHLAHKLGHDLEEGKRTPVGTGAGICTAYIHTCSIEFFDINDDTNIIYSINKAKIDFMPHLEIVLIGVKTFLSNFNLHIDYPQRLFSIKFPEV